MILYIHALQLHPKPDEPSRRRLTLGLSSVPSTHRVGENSLLNAVL